MRNNLNSTIPTLNSPFYLDSVCTNDSYSFAMHVIPNWLGGGFSWTNGCCTVLSLGGWSYSFSCGDNCLCGGCDANGCYGYEGYRLPADGGCCGCSGGGDDEDDDGDGDDDEDEHHGGVSVYFSRDAVIFEDAYETSPGVTVQKRSSTVRFRISAAGGDHGGTATFTQSNLGKLSALANGPLNIPSSIAIAPSQSYELEFECEGAYASGSANDVMVRGRFVENGTDWIDEDEERITVFKVEIQAECLPQGNECPNRHKYGVRELVNVEQTPAIPILAWNIKEGRMSGGKFQCPIRPCIDPIEFSYSGVRYIPAVQVVKPNGLHVDSVVEWESGLPIGESGGVGMVFRMFLEPEDVSFGGIAVEEVPCYIGSHSGYFSHSAFEQMWYHSRAAGAGKWLEVEANNYYGIDTAAISNALPRITPGGVLTNGVQFGWCDGELLWATPMGWGERNSVDYDEPEGEFAENETQQMIIFSDGKCGVRKYRHMVTREIDGKIFLDGRRVR